MEINNKIIENHGLELEEYKNIQKLLKKKSKLVRTRIFSIHVELSIVPISHLKFI